MTRKMPNGRRFQKGQSGNPSGRSRADSEIRDLARESTPKAWGRIVQLVDSKDERVALAAAQMVIERGYGKPKQPIDVDHSESLVEMLRRVEALHNKHAHGRRVQ